MLPCLGEKRPDNVIIMAFDPSWKQLYEQKRESLCSVVPRYMLDGDLATCVQHIGSTSVPGMQAKGVIDLQLHVVSTDMFLEGQAGCKIIQLLGYEYRGESGIFDRVYFRRGSPALFHLHVQRKDCRHTRRQYRDQTRLSSPMIEINMPISRIL